jgi:colicin V production protein
VRQLIALGAWLVSFIVAAYLRGPLGDWIAAQGGGYSRAYVEMLAFGIAFVVLFALAVVVIEIGGSTIQLTQRVALDQVLGGFLALGVGLLVIGALLIVLDGYYIYAGGPAVGAPDIDFVRALHAALDRSAIVQSLRGSLVPGLISLLGPLLPADIRAVYA